jgi:hypothetical protein
VTTAAAGTQSFDALQHGGDFAGSAAGTDRRQILEPQTVQVVKLIALFCIVSWRIFWLTMINRAGKQDAAGAVLTADEQAALNKAVPPKDPAMARHRSLGDYLTAIARLGGYLARRNDHPPGTMVIWRGMRRLEDIVLGMKIAKTYG